MHWPQDLIAAVPEEGVTAQRLRDAGARVVIGTAPAVLAEHDPVVCVGHSARAA